MKKVCAMLLALALLMFAVAAMGENAFKAGTYSGEATGMGKLVVSVTLSDTAIESIEVVESNETPSIGGAIMEDLIARVLAAQSTQLDTVSGATVTSNALYEAVNAALVSAGADPAALVPVEAEVSQESEEISCDVIIVGAGGAGMSAALKVNELGYTAIVIDKQAFVGGATAMSSSSALAQGTRVQAENGVIDSPELCMQELLVVGDYENDATPTWLLARYSGEAIDWLNDDMGVLFNESVGSASAEYSVGRARTSVTGSGAGLCEDLKNKLEEKGVRLILNTRAYELTDTDGVVDGVLARDVNTGKEYRFHAKAVLLATGGYCYSDYIDPSLLSLPNSGSKANTGDGIEMALPYGAVLQNMDMVAVAGHGIRIGDTAHHTQGQSKNAYKTTGAILVNMDGRRIENELGRHADLFPKMKEAGRTFMLMDEAGFKAYAESCVNANFFTQEQLDTWLEENGTGVTVMAHADTIEEVANIVGVNAENLLDEVARYTSFVEKGVDEDFGREVSVALGDGPYYLVEQCLRYSTTLGGITINKDLAVVDSMNAPIPGLYAAGELVGGVFGANFPPSTGVGWALTSGMLAGESIVNAIQ